MFEKKFYEKIQNRFKNYSAFIMIFLFFLTGISFMFMIPTLPGFNYIISCIFMLFYLFAANIYVGLYKNTYWKTFIFSLLLTTAGMAWRLVIESNETKLEAYMNWPVLILYPFVLALLITALSFIIIHYLIKDNNDDEAQAF